MGTGWGVAEDIVMAERDEIGAMTEGEGTDEMDATESGERAGREMGGGVEGAASFRGGREMRVMTGSPEVGEVGGSGLAAGEMRRERVRLCVCVGCVENWDG